MSKSLDEDDEEEVLKKFSDLSGKSNSLVDSRLHLEVALIKEVVPRVEWVVSRGRPCAEVARDSQLRISTRFGYAMLTRLPESWHVAGILPDSLCIDYSPDDVEWGVDLSGVKVGKDSHPNFGEYHVAARVKAPSALLSLLARVARE